MSEEKIREKIAEIVRQRDQLVQEANGSIAFLNGQIAALEALLAPEESEAEAE